jgi:hypothetical protein
MATYFLLVCTWKRMYYKKIITGVWGNHQSPGRPISEQCHKTEKTHLQLQRNWPSENDITAQLKTGHRHTGTDSVGWSSDDHWVPVWSLTDGCKCAVLRGIDVLENRCSPTSSEQHKSSGGETKEKPCNNSGTNTSCHDKGWQEKTRGRKGMVPGKVKMCILEMRQAELCSNKERKKEWKKERKMDRWT